MSSKIYLQKSFERFYSLQVPSIAENGIPKLLLELKETAKSARKSKRAYQPLPAITVNDLTKNSANETQDVIGWNTSFNSVPLIPPPIASFPPPIDSAAAKPQNDYCAKTIKSTGTKAVASILDPLQSASASLPVEWDPSKLRFVDLWETCLKAQRLPKTARLPAAAKSRLNGRNDAGAVFKATARTTVDATSGDVKAVLVLSDIITETRGADMLWTSRNGVTVPISKRAVRKYGADRFLSVSNPQADSVQLPRLFTALGCEWEHVYVQSIATLPRGGNGVTSTHVYFATSVQKSVDSRVPLLQLLNWHIPFNKENLQLPLVKFRKRMKLMFSKTLQGPKLDKYMITSVPDIYAETKAGRKVLMTDGCSALSFGLMRSIAERLSLQTVPSAIQARIGNAKGVWYIDPLTLPNDARFFAPQVPIPYDHHYANAPWISLRESQCKWHMPDPDRAHQSAVEVRQWTKPAASSRLNCQLLRVLEHQGVSPKVFSDMMQSQATRFENYILLSLKVLLGRSLKERQSSAVQLTALNTEFHMDVRHMLEPSSSAGASLQVTLMSQLSKLIKASREGGNRFLARCQLIQNIYSIYISYLKRLAMTMHINVRDSRSLLVIADPTGTLAANEIYVNVSDIGVLSGEVLVGRNPAYMPWDLQRVDAVFKKELEAYRDVVIFPTKLDTDKFNRSLADVLSGGDYDGDMVWLCWDRKLVSGFRPHTDIPQTESSDGSVGSAALVQRLVQKDSLASTPLSSFTPSELVEKLYELDMKSISARWLGLATVLHSYVADERELDDSFALDLGVLSCTLVDEGTSGIALSSGASAVLQDEFRRQRNPHWAYANQLIDLSNSLWNSAAYIRDEFRGSPRKQQSKRSLEASQTVSSQRIFNERKRSDENIHELMKALANRKVRRSRRARGVLVEILIDRIDSRAFLDKLIELVRYSR